MSPVEDPIAILRTLPRADRRAVLARLSPAERSRVAAVEQPPAATGYATDIAHRIADADAAMTAAGRAALLQAAGTVLPATPEAAGPSLLARLRDRIGGR